MPRTAALPLIFYAHGIFEDSPEGGNVYWGWLAQDNTGKQVAEGYDCFAEYVEPNQHGAEYEAVSGAIYWADKKNTKGFTIRTDHQTMLDFFAPGHTPTDEEIREYGTEALEFFHAMKATMEYVAPEQNLAVALCEKAKWKKIETEVQDSQATVRVVEKWLKGWPRVSDALEEMLERIVETGMDEQRDWLNGGIITQTELTLESMQAIIRAYEDTYPVILGGSTGDPGSNEEDVWDEDSGDDDIDAWDDDEDEL